MPQFTDDASSPFATDEELAAVVAGFSDQVTGAFPQVNVTTYGAIGDGATDDTAAIQAAIDAAGGGEVYIPPGSYLITSVITSDAKVVGSGPSTVILYAGTGGKVFDLTGDGASVSSLKIDGQSATQTGTGSGAIDIEADYCSVDDVVIVDATDMGIRVVDAHGARITNCRITDSVGSGIIAVSGSGADAYYVGPYIAGCTIDRSGISAGSFAGDGIAIAQNAADKPPWWGTQVVNNHIILATDPNADGLGFEINGYTNSHTIVKGNAVRGCSIGISLSGSDFSLADSNVVVGFSDAGIENAAGDNVTISNNAVEATGAGTAPPCITFNDGNGSHEPEFGVVSGNTILGTADIGRGIYLYKARSTTVSGNSISVDIDEAGSIFQEGGQRLTVTGNTLTGLDCIQLQNVPDFAITGNILYTSARAGVFFYGTTAVTFTGTITGNHTIGSAPLTDSALSGGAALGAIAKAGNSGDTLPVVSGSRGGNAALADLLTELATLGLITDSSS